MTAFDQAANYIKDAYDFLCDGEVETILEKAEICCNQEPCMDNTRSIIDEEAQKIMEDRGSDGNGDLNYELSQDK